MIDLYKASAGSGKTYTLSKTYLELLLQDKNPNSYRNILAVTFTNKAAKEMKERVNLLLDGSSNEVNISTFHSYGLNFLIRHRDLLHQYGYKDTFSIYSRFWRWKGRTKKLTGRG